ncbi:MAG TPA: ATP-binding cassette domain-containing protein [Bryobacteraceae bacterium]|nr:ATP-binding cassette domain-containing protein [Bryobacteraceae bacterium]
MAFVELENVSKAYEGGGAAPVKALDRVSFTVEAGQWIAIMGPSGSGKTTLLNILGCLDQATSGVVRIDAVDTSTLTRSELARFRAETVGFVFQQFHLIPHLTALENVMLAQYFHSMTDEAEARRALDRVGLGDRARHLPSQLSGGEQQRVAIARALVNDPKIILADEPTGNLDAANEQIVLDLLTELHQQGRTILMVTHDDQVGRRADIRLDLEHGRIVETTDFSLEENRDFDEVLEQLWAAREGSLHEEPEHFTAAQHRKVCVLMARIGLVEIHGGQVAFTRRGEERARSVIRRHRLAERLFTDVLAIRDEGSIESNACTFEHILSSEVTDRICTFLGHPRTCPHGSPIPEGDCCLEARGVSPACAEETLAEAK